VSTDATREETHAMQRLNGPEIVRLRQGLGMSQTDLAEAAGLKSSTLSQYETGARGRVSPTGRTHGRGVHPGIVSRIAKVLRVAREAILITVPDEEPAPEAEPTSDGKAA
jgi:transcriptional regulator with XRE-family HTH domain